MNFSRLTNDRVANAFDFMVDAHRGQKYGDLPYWTHPYQVAEMLDKNSTDVQYVAALFHDVIEDTNKSYQEMINHFPGDEQFILDVIDAVVLLTKDPTMSYEQNIQRIISSGNLDAMVVKYADNKVNYGGDKSHMPVARKNRLIKQYEASMKTLGAAISKQTTKATFYE